LLNTSGTGTDHINPIKLTNIAGTQIQCASLLVGF